jgi:Gpi18-like mannosyltransferase
MPATPKIASRWFDPQSVALVLFIKALLLFFAVIATTAMANQPVSFPEGWLELWNRWDAQHYLDIARDGYVTEDSRTQYQRHWIVFYPLFPWVVRVLNWLVREFVLSAHLVALAGAIATAIVFQRLVELDYERALARSAVVFMFIFPTAYFFHAGYTESLFMAVAVGCVLAARQRHWATAALLGALASLTRVNGLLLIPVMLIEAFMQYRGDGGRMQRRWLWIPLAGSGFLIYLAVNWRVWKDPFYFQTVMEQYWGKKLMWPWAGIARSATQALADIPWRSQLFGVQELVFIAIGLVCTVWCWRRLRPSYAVWMTLNWLLVTSTARIMSTPRYLLTFFPMFILFALLASEKPFRGTLLTIWSVAFFGLFATLFALGQWAF